MPSDPLSYLPLTESTFYILLSLAPDKKHGYAIMQDVAELSGQKVTLSTSTLYTALGRLLEQGLIERTSEEPEKHPGLPRKAYVLTANGRRVLEAETNRLQGLVTAARLRLDGEMA